MRNSHRDLYPPLSPRVAARLPAIYPVICMYRPTSAFMKDEAYLIEKLTMDDIVGAKRMPSPPYIKWRRRLQTQRLSTDTTENVCAWSSVDNC